ncbi:MAG: cytochrome P460 family protein, partial [Candidatus Brocadiales bacterium]
FNRGIVMKLRLLFVPFLLLGFFFLFNLSCAKYAPKEAVVAPPPPAADGKALWSYITKDSPYTGYKFWPGKTPLYKGTVPHGALLNLYVTENAHAAAVSKAGVMPDGSILVKENYKPDKTLASVTVMYKVAGYNPEANDWFWAKYSPAGDIMAEGKVPMCIACHGGRKANDYLMTQ